MMENVTGPKETKLTENEDGTCELVIYCYECKSLFQLSTSMIALAMISKTDIWEIYQYILTIECTECKRK